MKLGEIVLGNLEMSEMGLAERENLDDVLSFYGRNGSEQIGMIDTMRLDERALGERGLGEVALGGMENTVPGFVNLSSTTLRRLLRSFMPQQYM